MYYIIRILILYLNILTNTNTMPFFTSKYFDNYNSNYRIETIKKIIKNNPTNISFLWNTTHFINSLDEYNTINGQLIMEYCENLTWRPLTYKTPENDVYCYIVDQYSDVQEFISSYEYADYFIKTKEDEISEDEFYRCSGLHFGKTSDQIVYEIIKSIAYDDNEYKKYHKHKTPKYFKHYNSASFKSKEIYNPPEIVKNIGYVSDNYNEKSDEEDTHKLPNEYPEDYEDEKHDDYYQEDTKPNKRR